MLVFSQITLPAARNNVYPPPLPTTPRLCTQRSYHFIPIVKIQEASSLWKQLIYLFIFNLKKILNTGRLISNWILTSCQPHRVTSGESNSVISNFAFKNSSHMYTFSQVNPQNQSLHKQNTHAQTSDSTLKGVN